ARFAPAARFAKHAFSFATFLEVDGQRLGHATYGEVTGDFERLPAAFDFCALEGNRRNCFASKKSGLFRLRSRIELCVSRLSTGTDNSTELFEGLSLSKTTVPEMSLKRP